jgi:hypothetical protein
MDKIAKGMSKAGQQQEARSKSSVSRRERLAGFLDWAKGAARKFGDILRGSPREVKIPNLHRPRNDWPKR